jgi:MFS family permease
MKESERKTRLSDSGSHHSIVAGYLLALVSGALALVYEVLWMRQLTSFFGATAPATSATLSAMFLGIALGSAVIGSRCGQWQRPLRAYGFLEIGIGLGVLLVPVVLGLYEYIYPLLYTRFLGHQILFVAAKVVLAVLALFIPTFFMGGTICVLGQVFVSSPDKLGVTGSGLYAANTLGATMGALSVPFMLLPALGARWSYFAAVAASFLVGLAACWLDLRQKSVPSLPRVKVPKAAALSGMRDDPSPNGSSHPWRCCQAPSSWAWKFCGLACWHKCMKTPFMPTPLFWQFFLRVLPVAHFSAGFC